MLKLCNALFSGSCVEHLNNMMQVKLKNYVLSKIVSYFPIPAAFEFFEVYILQIFQINTGF